ncbi:hypothetical protein [Deinococcus yavapaiensis]|uniref:Uncharacterized protein n=1 Tax=Deinococcus yavapaiensis KR-236 TaxID=694435 RepID=A0A318S295_9DEIO|nr:hypothetical protein [Deinococcus yavapaiensis]PYE51957.1 hypothetical protein DES52_1133 [Deinococcus yavapaiensis KR-236]
MLVSLRTTLFFCLVFTLCVTAGACPAVPGTMANKAVPSILQGFTPVCGSVYRSIKEGRLDNPRYTDRSLTYRWLEVYTVPAAEKNAAVRRLVESLQRPAYKYEWRGEMKPEPNTSVTAYVSAVTGKGLWIVTAEDPAAAKLTRIALLGTNLVISSKAQYPAAASATFAIVLGSDIFPIVSTQYASARFYTPGKPSSPVGAAAPPFLPHQFATLTDDEFTTAALRNAFCKTFACQFKTTGGNEDGSSSVMYRLKDHPVTFGLVGDDILMSGKLSFQFYISQLMMERAFASTLQGKSILAQYTQAMLGTRSSFSSCPSVIEQRDATRRADITLECSVYWVNKGEANLITDAKLTAETEYIAYTITYLPGATSTTPLRTLTRPASSALRDTWCQQFDCSLVTMNAEHDFAALRTPALLEGSLFVYKPLEREGSAELRLRYKGSPLKLRDQLMSAFFWQFSGQHVAYTDLDCDENGLPIVLKETPQGALVGECDKYDAGGDGQTHYTLHTSRLSRDQVAALKRQRQWKIEDQATFDGFTAAVSRAYRSLPAGDDRLLGVRLICEKYWNAPVRPLCLTLEVSRSSNSTSTVPLTNVYVYYPAAMRSLIRHGSLYNAQVAGDPVPRNAVCMGQIKGLFSPSDVYIAVSKDDWSFWVTFNMDPRDLTHMLKCF